MKKGISAEKFEKMHAEAGRAAGEAYEKEGKLWRSKREGTNGVKK